MIDSLDLGLKGKVAIVAGGGAVGNGIGNGRAASILLADAGVNVLVVDKDEVLANSITPVELVPKNNILFEFNNYKMYIAIENE